MKRKICIVLMIMVLCCNLTVFSFASSVSELQNQKNETEDKKDELEEEMEEVEAEKNEALSKIEELSTQISESETELDKLRDEIEELENAIDKKEKELEEAQEKQAKQEEALEQRIVAQYKTGKMSYWDILLNPSSPLDFMNKLFCFEKIAKADQQLLESIQEEKNKIEAAKEDLANQKSKVKTAKANAEKENVKLKNAKAVKNSEVAKLEDKEKSIQAEIDKYEQEMKDLEAEIRKAQEANKNSGSTKVTYNGQMAWPVPSSGKITSQYGMRIHPIYKVPKLHKGIDIGGAAWGAPFVAADDGVVILARYNGTYGNCVIIDHGGGISTLYAHGSAIYVSAGQTVKRGQNVLAIGSSGASTGKHAHFEVRVNGQAVNPLPYVT